MAHHCWFMSPSNSSGLAFCVLDLICLGSNFPWSKATHIWHTHPLVFMEFGWDFTSKSVLYAIRLDISKGLVCLHRTRRNSWVNGFYSLDYWRGEGKGKRYNVSVKDKRWRCRYWIAKVVAGYSFSIFLHFYFHKRKVFLWWPFGYPLLFVIFNQLGYEFLCISLQTNKP